MTCGRGREPVIFILSVGRFGRSDQPNLPPDQKYFGAQSYDAA